MIYDGDNRPMSDDPDLQHALTWCRPTPAGDDGVTLYLELIKRSLVNWLYAAEEVKPFDLDMRAAGADHPPTAHTMIGLSRLDNLQFCLEDVLAHDIPGDVIETGVWRGGATVLMRAILKARGVTDRTVWVADSFEGLPPPDVAFPQDDANAEFYASAKPFLSVSLERVQSTFAAYGLLDDQVRFLKGWFADTLPTAPIDRLAVLRLDGDMYKSTIDTLTALYPKVSVGGYVIVDDYGCIEVCKQAIHDFRDAHGIDEEIQRACSSLGVPDCTGVYWKREH